jgi:hypothetical protein
MAVWHPQAGEDLAVAVSAELSAMLASSSDLWQIVAAKVSDGREVCIVLRNQTRQKSMTVLLDRASARELGTMIRDTAA